MHPGNPAGWSTATEIRLTRGELAEAYRLFMKAEARDLLNAEFPAYRATILSTAGLILANGWQFL